MRGCGGCAHHLYSFIRLRHPRLAGSGVHSDRCVPTLSVVPNQEPPVTSSPPVTAIVRGGRADVVFASVVETRRVGGASTTSHFLLAAVTVVRKVPVSGERPGGLTLRLPMPIRGRARVSASLPPVAATAIRARGPCTWTPHWTSAGAVMVAMHSRTATRRVRTKRYHVHSISSSLPVALLLSMSVHNLAEAAALLSALRCASTTLPVGVAHRLTVRPLFWPTMRAGSGGTAPSLSSPMEEGTAAAVTVGR